MSSRKIVVRKPVRPGHRSHSERLGREARAAKMKKTRGAIAAEAASAPVEQQGGVDVGSKQALLIERISCSDGARIDDLTKDLGWLPHTVRAALTGLRRKGYVITLTRAEGGASVYRAAPLVAGESPVEGKRVSRAKKTLSTRPTMKKLMRVGSKRVA